MFMTTHYGGNRCAFNTKFDSGYIYYFVNISNYLLYDIVKLNKGSNDQVNNI